MTTHSRVSIPERRELRRDAVDIHILRCNRITTPLGDQCPARANRVVTIPELGQAFPGVRRTIVQQPIDLFVLQRFMEPFQQSQLCRWADVAVTNRQTYRIMKEYELLQKRRSRKAEVYYRRRHRTNCCQRGRTAIGRWM